MNGQPIISVAICTYNGEPYLAPQLESILAQTRPVDEVILCDDGSSDGTLAVARRILEGSGTSYAVYQNVPGLGVAKNFERAIGLCRGDIIFTCDQDDIWKPNKVAAMTELFEREPDCVLVFSDAEVTAADGATVLGGLWDSVRFSAARRQQFGLDGNYELLFGGNVVTGACMAVRRDFALACRPFPGEYLLHDDWLALCAACQNGLRPLPERLVCYRQHGGNVVGVHSRSLPAKMRRWLRPVFEGTDNRFYLLARAELVCQRLPVDGPAFTDWLAFCRARAELYRQGRLRGAAWVLRRASQGDYRRYTALTVGCAFRDFLMALLGTSPLPPEKGSA